ncbi:probable sodium/potassium/calcium exchanger CG1090 [Bradysia coprophila]|uniref:probable sodium/potassium/calcium exchanger CG1090 n=1 Tax=Bradysia coprophila TaxID=38358 RepID=UPI00187D9917|nr:probable sodium/potassium/calcium exchanger CG1090 [Bradysia coprophila]XP_037028048.1 probable sodium/potassium/calcium exchanger CG1090 [Bradysia coprophila]XP_037028049.1 probable sodium/potassium/calcium exchanger CG1090 [Bradysia coprophila]
MARSCQGRVINWALIFLIYCSIQVYSATTQGPFTEFDEISTSNVAPNIEIEKSTETTTTNTIYYVPNLLYIPRRTRCIPPDIERYPRPLIPQTWRKNGGLIVHVLVVLFTIVGLNVVCDGYFVSSIHRISEKLKLSPEDAGSTFMAVGTSIYKLLMAVIGPFFDFEGKDGVSVSSGIVGSTVFNVILISACALCSGTVCYLNWRNLVRDCVFCLISIVAMFVVTINDHIAWYETVSMVLFYIVYCAVVFINTSRKRKAQAINSKQINQASVAISQPKVTNQETQIIDHPSKDSGPHEILDPLEKPINTSLLARIFRAIAYPIQYVCELTIPDCRTYRNRYALTFVMSIIWILLYSYLMVWQITIIGYTIGIPDAVMRLTFVAAGISVPKVLSSIAVIKEGYGDMVIPHALGSTIFDILICLGLKWLIQTTLIDYGGHINVLSKGLTYSTIWLISSVVLLLLSLRLNGWKLDRRIGYILLALLLVYITIALMYALNVFGIENPLQCNTLY